MANNFLPRATMGYAAHLFKALAKQHHKEMIPFLKQYVPADGVVFDVGAHAGQFTKLFSKMAPKGHVYAFEPGRYPLSILRKVIALHRLKNVSLFACGLGDKAEENELHMPVKKSGSMGYGLSHIGKAHDGRPVRTETITIAAVDAFVREHGIKRLDFIKADIEGWEMRMLTGAINTLATLRPSMMLEASDAYLVRAGDSVAALYAFLEKCGYGVFSMGAQYADMRPADAGGGDIVCIPREKIANAQ